MHRWHLGCIDSKRAALPRGRAEAMIIPVGTFYRDRRVTRSVPRTLGRIGYLQKPPTPMLDNARQRSTRPCPICDTENAREIAFATSPGLYVGRACRTSAASPATSGVLNEVPQPAA